MPRGFQTDPPVVMASLQCDQVGQSPDGKPMLIGVFDQVNASEFPHRHPQTVYYLKIGPVLEPMEVEIRLVNPEGDQIVKRVGPIPVQPPGNNYPVGVGIVDGPTEFSQPGRYDIRVYINETFLSQSPLRVAQIQR